VLGDIIQPTHLLFILVIALLVLGPKRLPEVGRSLGRGIRDFRDAVSSHTAEARELREMVYAEDSLGGTATTSEHPVATTTPTADAGAMEPSTLSATADVPASEHAPADGPVAAHPGANGGSRSGVAVREQPGIEPIYSD
jgi:sec-independent protein translocase protein TatA